MKKFFFVAILLTTGIATAFGQQVGIGTDQPDASSILELDVSSYAADNKKGFLPPRMTEEERNHLTPTAAEGLVIYNLTEHCLNYKNATQWVSMCEDSIGNNDGNDDNETPAVADFTIIANNTNAEGYLVKGLPANTVDIAAKQNIEVNVIVPGAYNFTTSSVNGVIFAATGTFTSTGIQTVVLSATGTPENYTVDDNTISYTVTNVGDTNAGNCIFNRKVYVPDQNYMGAIRNTGKHRFIYKVVTGIGGKEWLATNLGAHYNQVGHPNFDPEKVAQNVDDYLAFGSLFQAGKNSDGHELMTWTSATTGTPSSGTYTLSSNLPVIFSDPAANDGLFYTSSQYHYGIKSINSETNEFFVGPGDPCPVGFYIPKRSPDDFQLAVNYNRGEVALFNDFQLVAPKVYRSATNGSIVPYNRRLIRTGQLGLALSPTASSAQFVISGGSLENFIDGNSALYDRGWIESGATNGSLDGYPVRCIKK